MNFDTSSVLIMTALVVNVSGILFIVETLLRRDEGAGRVWALGFLAAMLTTLAYTVWALSELTWWPIAVGNAAFVAATGCMWLGCRRFNGRSMLWASLLVVLAVLGAGASVAVEGDAGDDWTGALWMFVPLIVFAALGSVECFRGALRESRTAWVLGGVLGLQALYYVSRTTAFVTSGPDSALFQTAFGTVTTGFITVTLTIVAVVVTSVLRAMRAPMRGRTLSDVVEILDRDTFAGVLGSLSARAAWRSELVAVTSVRIDDLDQIATAFGSEVTGTVVETWRAAVRRFAPTNAVVAEDGPTGLVVALVVASPEEARRQAAALYRGLFDELGRGRVDVIPVVGVGVALSDTAGYQPEDLLRVAREAASRSATDVEASVLIGDVD